MRLIALLLAIVGALLAFGYPVWIGASAGTEIARYALSPDAGVPGGPQISLGPGDAPVSASLLIATPSVALRPARGEAVATFDISVEEGAQNLARGALRFTFSYPDDRAMAPVETHLEQIGVVFSPPEASSYRVRVVRTDDGSMPLRSVTLIMKRNHRPLDRRIAPAGFILLVVGVVGFAVLSRRRRGTS